MKRRLLNLLTALSLLLCVAAVGLWARSLYVSDHWIWVGHPAGSAPPEHRFSLLSHSGQFSVNWARTPLTRADRYPGRWAHETRRPPVQFWWKNSAGTSSFWNRRGFAAFETDVHAPAWSVAMVPGAVAFLASRPWRLAGSRRRRHGLCVHCGYDLRATPGRCPECGADPAAEDGRR